MDINSVTRMCHAISRQIAEVNKPLKIHWIVHHAGQRAETAALEEHDISRHPAGTHALNILRRKRDDDNTSFLGLAVASESKFFGLINRSHLLALLSVNIDQFKDARAIKRNLYQQVWHALDLSEIRERKEYKDKFRNGPMVPKRSPMNRAKANLRADVFSAIMVALEGNKKAIREAAEERCMMALTPHHGYRAEDFPFIIAMEAAIFSFRETKKGNGNRARTIKTALEIAEEISKTFDETSIRQWWAFSQPAQDMAWRGHTPKEILGAAINTSEDPYVRATGLLIYEIMNIEPRSSSELVGVYNAYADPELNERLHRETADEIFEGIIAQGIFENSGAPFITGANEQNKNLTEGKIMGWCASALQAAASAFESALASGESPTKAARREYHENQKQTEWDTVKKLGDKIIEQRRNGYAVTFTELLELCNQEEDFHIIRSSVENTVQDPEFQKKLEAAAEFTPEVKPGMDPVATPKAAPKAAPSGPVYAAAPGLGGGNNAQRIRQQAFERQKQAREQSDATNTQNGDNKE